jgi:hypothetical protein
MKLLKIAWLFAIAFPLIFASCKKEIEDSLPPATQTGAGTFGCKINGKVYVPKGSSGTGAPNPKVQYDVDLQGKPYLSIETFQYPSDNTGCRITFRYLENTGFFSVKDSLRFDYGWPSVIGDCGNSSADPNIFSTGGGVITSINLANRIVSGTFAFKVKNSICDTIFITDGRFDIKF